MKRTKKQKKTKKQVEFDLNKLKPSILFSLREDILFSFGKFLVQPWALIDNNI